MSSRAREVGLVLVLWLVGGAGTTTCTADPGAPTPRTAPATSREVPSPAGPADAAAASAPTVPTEPAAAGAIEPSEVESPPPSPRAPVSVPTFTATRDSSPVFLPRAAVLWLRQSGPNLFVCVAERPYRTVTSAHRLGPQSPTLNAIARVVASSDGRHAFVRLPSGVTHLSLERGAVTGEEAVTDATGLHMAPSADGARLFTEVDGPPTPRVSPGWRAVAMFSRSGAGWNRLLLTGTREGELAELIGARADGRAALYAEGRRDAVGTPERIVLAEEAQPAWSRRAVDQRGWALGPRAIAADGSLVLLQGWERARAATDRAFHLWVARREGAGWARPELVVRDSPRGTVFVPGLSPDGRQVFWESYQRAADGNTVVRSEVRVVDGRDGRWSEPRVVLAREGFFQIDQMAFSGQGQAVLAAWPTDPAEREQFVLHAFAIANIDDPATVVDLAGLDCAGRAAAR